MGQILNTQSGDVIDGSMATFNKDDEVHEEIRMISGLELPEIIRLKKLFLIKTDDQLFMTIDAFKSFPGIGNSPLCDRICSIIGFSEVKVPNAISLQQFITGIALFNSTGQREQKLKTAFTIQDYDSDGLISKYDLSKYIQAITSGALDEKALQLLVDQVFDETSSHPENEYISYVDFQRVVGPTDFHIKLRLPI